jgi:exodeoxyribonuclease V alpha subunit
VTDEFLQTLDLHRDRAAFPARVVEHLKTLNQAPSNLIFAWELSGFAPGLDGPERKRLFAVILALLSAQGQGHTRMPVVAVEGGPADLLFQAFNLDPFDLAAFLRASAGALTGAPGDAKPLILQDGWLYSQRLLGHEQDLATLIAGLQAETSGQVVDPPEAIFQLRAGRELNAEQRQAVAMALRGGLTLITGGPGTGKTSIVVTILRALLRQPGIRLEDIALAAPTGKAAQRMGESIMESLAQLENTEGIDLDLQRATLDPSTLHRLLAWHPARERFRHGPGNPLPARIVIADEASMISQEHMCRLLGALAPDARLVLLGDANQLPSVEEGCAFSDMVKSLTGQCVTLRTSYRMDASDPEGRNILSVAAAIRRNTELWQAAEPIHVRATLADLRFRQVELLEPAPGVMEAFLELWLQREVTSLEGFLPMVSRNYSFARGAWAEADQVPLAALFRHFNQFRILCALREAPGLRGVQDINRHFHKRMLALTGEGLRNPVPFCAGEPLMMTANDYRRGIYNGDQGLVLKVLFDGVLRQAAVFPRPGGFVPFPLDPLKHQMEHAFAMTIHKSQGSEYKRIAIVLPRSNHRALTRELLYTGLTRASKAVVLLAERERVPFAAGNPSLRESGLAARLGGAVATDRA